MSLILDALNRARRERGEASPTGVPTAVARAPGREPLVALLAVALVLACGAIGWLGWERWGASPAEAPAKSPVGAAASPQAAVKRGDGSRREGAPPTSVPPTNAPPASAPLTNAPPTSAPPTSARPTSAPPTGARSGSGNTDPAVAALYAEPAAEAAAPEPAPEPVAEPAVAPPRNGTGEDSIDIEAVLARAREELGEPALVEHPAPLLAELSQQQKDAIPTLMYLRHDYVKDGAGNVLINGEQRRVGDRIGAVEVAEILPDSVVLRYRDTLFRLRALNSWINL